MPILESQPTSLALPMPALMSRGSKRRPALPPARPHEGRGSAQPRPGTTVAVDGAVLQKLLRHASSAARLVGAVEDRGAANLAIDALADDIDAVVHELCELLGTPGAHAVTPRCRSAAESADTSANALPVAAGDDDDSEVPQGLRRWWAWRAAHTAGVVLIALGLVGALAWLLRGGS